MKLYRQFSNGEPELFRRNHRASINCYFPCVKIVKMTTFVFICFCKAVHQVYITNNHNMEREDNLRPVGELQCPIKLQLLNIRHLRKDTAFQQPTASFFFSGAL